MPKHQASPSREQRQAAKDKRAKRAQARDAKKRGRVPSSSSEDENEFARTMQTNTTIKARFIRSDGSAGRVRIPAGSKVRFHNRFPFL